MSAQDKIRWRAHLEGWLRAGLRAVSPREAVRRHMRCDGAQLIVGGHVLDLSHYPDRRLIAVGKAALPMAQAVMEQIGGTWTRKVIVTRRGYTASLSTAEQAVLSPLFQDSVFIESGHPIPDEDSLRAGEAVAQALKHCSPATLVIACISGGASALMVLPVEGYSLADIQAATTHLLQSGADIYQLNAVRTAMDQLKGGGLARLAQPAHVVGLLLSDVVGDPIAVIGSGPTALPGVPNVIVANNAAACAAIAEAAQAAGMQPRLVTTTLQGEAREVGLQIAQALLVAPPTSCLIYGGETTVTLGGSGKGGRNQELALAAAIALDAQNAAPGDCVVAFGTDGSDGPTDVAGAIAWHDSVARARSLALDAVALLRHNDSYAFFAPLGDHIRTGPTGTNVADVIVAARLGTLAHVT
ncbi:MAG: glycerate kinase [Thermoflexales bacterium]